jgi:hypothetical protein
MAGAQSAFVYDESYAANADLSAKQYFCVKYVAGPKVDLCAAATDRCVGVLQNKPAASGRNSVVRHHGITKAVSDGSGTAIAVGDPVGTDANGRVVKKATADYGLIGEALDASSALGTIIRVRLYGQIVPFRTIAG